MTTDSSTRFFDQLLAIKNRPESRLAVLGLGVENWQFINWAIEVVGIRAAQLILIDQREPLVVPKQYADLLDIDQANFVGGAGYLQWFLTQKADLVVKAPGIWSLKNELEYYRSQHGEASIISSLTFFVERFREIIVGVTGTKGKTTTCSLVAHFLRDPGLGKQIEYCGNTTNISPYQFWSNLTDTLDNCIFVFELSSFQLQDLGYAKLSPKYAGITNYYIDHLDQHNSVEEYHNAKSNIFEWQNSGDVIVVPLEIRDIVKDRVGLEVDMVSPFEDGRFNFVTGLKGEHNQTNINTAEILAGRVFRDNNLEWPLSVEYIQAKLETFEAPKGRLELVKTLDIKKVKFNFFNDNTATEPDAVCACVEALTQSPDKLMLILAGKVKQGNYSKLIETLESKKSSILRIDYCGQVGTKIQVMQGLQTTNQSLKTYLSTNWNYLQLIQDYHLQPGQNVNISLSPGGSSFDEFVNYIERGNFYLQWVANQK